MSRVVIIIPTYNERENTVRMIDALAQVMPRVKGHAVLVLYVDGNSPDGTADVVREGQKIYPWLHLLMEKEKGGLGAAYAFGMKHAMKDLNADYMMEFDADLQHDPNDIPRLIAEIDNGYDYILGSRYVKGGGVSDGWGFKRKFISVAGNMFARCVLGIWGIKDVTGGFKLSRVKGFMDSFDFSKLLSKSFAYKIHLLFYMYKKGAKVKEVPYIFQPRATGQSKIPSNEIKETLRVVFALRAVGK